MGAKEAYKWANVSTSYFSWFNLAVFFLYEKRQGIRRNPVTGVIDGAVVSEKNDLRERAVRFLVNGNEMLDIYGHPYGWRSTYLPEKSSPGSQVPFSYIAQVINSSCTNK